MDKQAQVITELSTKGYDEPSREAEHFNSTGSYLKPTNPDKHPALFPKLHLRTLTMLRAYSLCTPNSQ